MDYIDINIKVSYIEANVIVGMLKNKNIDCFLIDEYCSAMVLAPTEITPKVFVKKKDFIRARSIVEKFLGRQKA